MKIVNKIKSTLQDSLGNELIGIDDDDDLDMQKEQEEKEIKQKKKKVEKKQKPMESVFDLGIEKNDIYSTGELEPNNTVENNSDSAVLDILKISNTINLEGLITPDDIEQAEFSLSMPSGIDPNEVETFLNKIQKDLSKIYTRIREREADFNKLLRETDRLQTRIVEINQSRSMLDTLNKNKDTIDSLKNQIVDLRIENTTLKSTIDKYAAMEKELEKMKLQEELRKEKENAKAEKAKTLKDLSKHEEDNIDEEMELLKSFQKNKPKEDKDIFSSLVDDIS